MFGELNPKQDEYLQDVLSSGRHLLSLINDILDLSKVEAGRMELELARFDLPQAMQDTLVLVRERAARHGIDLHLEVDGGVGEVVADERKIKQVMLNLLSNAVKFTPEGGRVDVRTVPTDGGVEVSVADTGIGIAPENQELIFEEFRQVGGDYAHKREGTGLGLTLARRFVELHGGRIWVKSQPGHGSTFTFSIPGRRAHPRGAGDRGHRLRDEPGSAEDHVRRLRRVPGQADRRHRLRGRGAGDDRATHEGRKHAVSEPVRILVVDDTPMNVKLLEGVLSGHGFVVITAPSGPLVCGRLRADRSDVVLLFLVMPEMWGYVVCRRLRADEATRLLPIIMVTALDPGTERVKGIEVGADDFLTKP